MSKQFITADKTVANFDDAGKLHCEDGPAVVWSDGCLEWWHHGKRHREGGPAVTWADGTTFWYNDGVRHRIDGPATELPMENPNDYVDFHQSNEWFFEGTKYSYDEWLTKIPESYRLVELLKHGNRTT